MIRPYKNEDIQKIIDIWYKGSVQAHHFIDASYWESKMQEMKDKYIPMSETHVITDQSEIIGFISMVGNYLAALFIDVRNQNNGGAGRELLNFEKRRRNIMQLRVYQENALAINFYLKNGFVLKDELRDEQTGKAEYLMEWKKA
ncbi:GNAT family N-acetyltransferase [Gracilibacillus sp. JCM 18860]|uniref:GNAT family N-acetyltransferase n=1 Tax=Gracilibacillus sp. JCM 18860 TaxID=1306159 RepID=UPI0006D0FA19